jgi:hypothetical protein
MIMSFTGSLILTPCIYQALIIEKKRGYRLTLPGTKSMLDVTWKYIFQYFSSKESIAANGSFITFLEFSIEMCGYI